MPITITVPQPLNKLGPGLVYTATTDFIGPIPNGWKYWWTFSTAAEWNASNTISQVQVNANNFNQSFYTLYSEDRTSIRAVGAQVGNGDTAYLTVELRSGTGVVEDSGTISKVWDATAGLGYLAFQNQAVPASSTFTATDRTNMATGFTNVLDGLTATLKTAAGDVTATLGALFSRSTLDKLTLAELTAGPTGAPLRVTVDSFWYGVIVRITTIPAALTPFTPDADWYLPDLAVLRVRRGVDLEYRRGIHTSSWMAPSPWKFGLELIDLIELGATPPETEVLVDFAPGVEGQVYLMRFP